MELRKKFYCLLQLPIMYLFISLIHDIRIEGMPHVLLVSIPTLVSFYINKVRKILRMSTRKFFSFSFKSLSFVISASDMHDTCCSTCTLKQHSNCARSFVQEVVRGEKVHYPSFTPHFKSFPQKYKNIFQVQFNQKRVYDSTQVR